LSAEIEHPRVLKPHLHPLRNALAHPTRCTRPPFIIRRLARVAGSGARRAPVHGIAFTARCACEPSRAAHEVQWAGSSRFGLSELPPRDGCETRIMVVVPDLYGGRRIPDQRKATGGDLMTAERARLEEDRQRQAPWKKWGPYLSERQWGTVRE